MKFIITVFFIIFIGVSAQSQEVNNSSEKENVATVNFKEVVSEKENNVARLYMFRNYRVKKALSFATKRNKAKLA